ncbi:MULTISPECIES: hypothetical protein [Cellulosilyticum]|uniref:Phage major tail protein, TP901-1 family n=1 Tax=Cellulosilyticum lentocellum (strain ATCC 49066 / DSM 5427 / NCIMB 11756 / RHM5) TaxID=642492 RepID=F2JQ11_CELLD|nr:MULTISPECIES: hypothetical protein [Cellulosilyticum]ADZ82559.1 hypothetical protein Clole_0826 [Cellulosilyticum lentocellum DSM 5427]QEH69719.1 hypothetical protein EKH84_15490 [Cellulosilyticum sp. WCF-2]
MKLVAREDKVLFYGVPSGSSGSVTYAYKRAQGFTDASKSHNPVEYNRRYVDEKAARTNVVGYEPSIAFAFDQILDNDVHEDIVGIIDGEKINDEATRPLIMVDLTTKTGDAGSETYTGYKRDFSIIPSSEGGSTDAYTYSGDFKANGEVITVTGTLSADGLTFTPSV